MMLRRGVNQRFHLACQLLEFAFQADPHYSLDLADLDRDAGSLALSGALG